jgi:hypothetical protein
VAKKLRCYLGLHRFVLRKREGRSYKECRDCGKYVDTSEPMPPPFAGVG